MLILNTPSNSIKSFHFSILIFFEKVSILSSYNCKILSIEVMASLATFTPTTIAVKGLGGSSLAGTKLNHRLSRQSFRPTSCRSGAVVVRYGDKSVYLDLEDLGNTTGQWDVYGSDAP